MLLEKEKAQAIARMLAHGYYKKKLPVINKYFRRSRGFLVHFDMFVNALQVGIMNPLYEVQKAVTKGKQLLDSGISDDDERKRVVESLLMNRHLVRVLQSIVDGIAWRSLLYRRPILRLLSENKSSGYLTDHEIKTYKKVLLRTRHRIIVNDLTHYLRIADFTQIEKTGHVILFESKKRGKIIKDTTDIFNSLKDNKREPTPQELRQIVAQMSFVDSKISIPVYQSGKLTMIEYEIIDDDFRISTHHNEIRKMIKIANRQGYCTKAVEPGYLVNIVAYDKMAENKKQFDNKFEEYKAQYKERRTECFGENKSSLISVSSWDTFYEKAGHFPRNYTPLSVLPFNNKDCVRLMMGFLKIDVIFDIDVLIQRIKDEGWEAELNTEIPKQPRIDPHEYKSFSSYTQNYDQNNIEDFIKVQKTEGDRTLHMTIPFTYLLIMLSSLYKISFITDGLMSRFSDPDKRGLPTNPQRLAINFSDEKNILK